MGPHHCRWHYGAGLDVCARLIEVLADQPLGDFLRERLFDPLGMRTRRSACPSTPGPAGRDVRRPGPARPRSDRRRPGRSVDDRRQRPTDVSETNPADAMDTLARGGFGLFSTALDYTSFARMLLRGGELDGARIVTPDTARLMHRNHLPDELLPFVPAIAPATGSVRSGDADRAGPARGVDGRRCRSAAARPRARLEARRVSDDETDVTNDCDWTNITPELRAAPAAPTGRSCRWPCSSGRWPSSTRSPPAADDPPAPCEEREALSERRCGGR